MSRIWRQQRRLQGLPVIQKLEVLAAPTLRHLYLKVSGPLFFLDTFINTFVVAVLHAANGEQRCTVQAFIIFFFFFACFSAQRDSCEKSLGRGCKQLHLPSSSHVGVRLDSQECRAAFLRLRNQMRSQVDDFYRADFIRCLSKKARYPDWHVGKRREVYVLGFHIVCIPKLRNNSG